MKTVKCVHKLVMVSKCASAYGIQEAHDVTSANVTRHGYRCKLRMPVSVNGRNNDASDAERRATMIAMHC